MTIKKIALVLSLTLSACSNLDGNMFTQQNDSPITDEMAVEESTLNSSLQFTNQYNMQLKRQNEANMAAQAQQKKQSETNIATQEQTKQAENLPQFNINFYVRGLMQDLVSNLQYVNSTTPVAVVTFVMLDGDYNQGNLLGNQIAESLMHEIHKFGIPVIDFKTTDYIRVTETGDFAFTRDYEEVNPSMPARYIVGGTMVKHQGGYLINARIVGIESKAVVASAQRFIPKNVTDALLTSATPSLNHEYTINHDNSPSPTLQELISDNTNLKPEAPRSPAGKSSTTTKQHFVSLTQD